MLLKRHFPRCTWKLTQPTAGPLPASLFSPQRNASPYQSKWVQLPSTLIYWQGSIKGPLCKREAGSLAFFFFFFMKDAISIPTSLDTSGSIPCSSIPSPPSKIPSLSKVLNTKTALWLGNSNKHWILKSPPQLRLVCSIFFPTSHWSKTNWWPNYWTERKHFH